MYDVTDSDVVPPKRHPAVGVISMNGSRDAFVTGPVPIPTTPAAWSIALGPAASDTPGGGGGGVKYGWASAFTRITASRLSLSRYSASFFWNCVSCSRLRRSAFTSPNGL